VVVREEERSLIIKFFLPIFNLFFWYFIFLIILRYVFQDCNLKRLSRLFNLTFFYLKPFIFLVFSTIPPDPTPFHLMSAVFLLVRCIPLPNNFSTQKTIVFFQKCPRCCFFRNWMLFVWIGRGSANSSNKLNAFSNRGHSNLKLIWRGLRSPFWSAVKIRHSSDLFTPFSKYPNFGLLLALKYKE